MELSDQQMYAILATAATFLAAGLLAPHPLVAAIPLVAATGFLAVTLLSDELYSRIPEDVQATVVTALLGGALLSTVGVVLRRVR